MRVGTRHRGWLAKWLNGGQDGEGWQDNQQGSPPNRELGRVARKASVKDRLVGMVEPDWYAAKYPDVSAWSAADHFAKVGHLELRDPCRSFDTDWYLLQYPDVAQAVEAGDTTPALHYVMWGASEARSTHAAVDVKWMLSEYPALQAEEIVGALCRRLPSIYQHVIAREAVVPQDPSRPLISAETYRPPWDVPPIVGCSREISVATDYIMRGEAADIVPSPWFDPAWYRQQYPDVVAVGQSLLGHFLASGEQEGRLGVPPMPRETMAAKLRGLAHAVPEASVMLGGDSYTWSSPWKDQWTNVGLVLADILEEFANSGIKYLVLVPFFGVGGAEKVAKAAYHFLGSLGQGDTLVLATEPFGGQGSIPEAPGVRAARLEDFCGRLKPGTSLSPGERAEVAARLILTLAPALTLVVNSQAGWIAVRDAGRRLSSVSRLVGAYFCYDYLEDGTRVGYAAQTPPSCLGWLHAVLMDNASFADILAADHALVTADRAKLHVVYQPVRLPVAGTETRDGPSDRRGSRVLWANRICRQKNLASLLRIAAAAPDLHFDVFGTGDIPDDYPSNVHFKGRFDGLHSLPLEEYGSFVYTSLWDGLPNVLLEAADSGLPIVAADVGGVAELIGPTTGYLVDSPEHIDGYLAALTEIVNDPQEATRRAAQARRLVAERHSWESYETQMSALLAAAGLEGFVRLAPPGVAGSRGPGWPS